MNVGEDYSIEIKSMLGDIIYSGALYEIRSEIDMSCLHAAFYLYEIENNEGMRVACGELLKE